MHTRQARDAACTPCRKAYRAQYHQKNREHTLKINKAWALRNPENVKRRSAEWHANNLKRHAQLNSAWYLRNREKHLARGRAWYETNKETRAETIRDWRRLNPERCKAACERYYRRHPERLAEIRKRWAAKNPAAVRANAMKRHARKRQATPPWMTKRHHEQIIAFYEAAVLLERVTGIKHHVDHIYPLRGRVSCGLHVPWNLQILPARDNLRKGNREPPL